MQKLNQVLIVDDDPAWRQITADLLQDNECEITFAGSLVEAEEIINTKLFDLAVLDLSLSAVDHKNTDGLTLLKLVHLHNPKCKCIMMTGFATVDIAVKAIVEYGAINFFRKESLVLSEFVDVLKQHFDMGSKTSTPEQQPVGTHIPPANSPRKNALIIEDDPNWRSIHVDLLDSMDYGYAECSSYGQAIGQLARADFDVILLDLTLNDEREKLGNNVTLGHPEGIKLLKHIKDKNTPIIIISGLTSPDVIDTIYRDQNIFAYFEKSNFERNLLRKAIIDASIEIVGNTVDNELTQREAEVLQLVTQGLTNKEISVRLFITPNTVKRHLKSIFQKMDVHTRSGAVAKAISKA